MQRTAVDRIGDLVGLVWYSIFVSYVGYWGTAYTYAVFFLHQYPHILDMVFFWGFGLFVGYSWGVYLGRIIKYRTAPWFFRNLMVYVPVICGNLRDKLVYWCWYGLALALIGLMKHLLVVTSWVTARAWPGRGIVFNMDFEDERDFKNMVRTAQEDELPITARVDGRLIYPEEYDAPLSQHNLLGGVYHPTYDEDILDTSLTFPSFAAIHVVDADPTEL